MASPSIVSKTKSTDWLRPKWSGNTESPTARTEVSVGEDQHTLAIENLLPATCYKYGCPVPVLVKKDFIRGDFSKIWKRKESLIKGKENIKTASSRTSSCRRDTLEREKTVKTEPCRNSVVISARYDKSNRLTALVMNKANIRNRHIMQVIAILAPFYGTLSKIVIQRSRINAYVIHDLSKMLPLTTITEICLDESPLPEANYAKLLDMDGVLKYLSLARCLIDDVICKQIASKLHYNMVAGKQLLTLNLSSNHISDEGAKFLADALRTNRRLKYLNLANNRITDSGFIHILDTLTEFPLTHNEMVQKKRCYFEYLKKRLAFSMEQLNFTGLKSFTDSTGSPRNSKIVSNSNNDAIVSANSSVKIAPKYSPDRKSDGTAIAQIKKNKTQNRIRSSDKDKVNSAKPVIYNSKQSETVNSKDLNSLLDPMGPFSPDTLVEKDGWAYSKGNLELSYLNVAYNELTIIGMKKLSKVLTCQCEVGQPGETGLIKINIEGNMLPVNCAEIRIINSMLANILNSKRSSKTKSLILT